MLGHRNGSIPVLCSAADYPEYELSHENAFVLTRDKHATQDLDLYYRPTLEEERAAAQTDSSTSYSGMGMGMGHGAAAWARRANFGLLGASTRAVGLGAGGAPGTPAQPDGSWELRHPRQKLFVCCAETTNLMNKWVSVLSM